MTVIGKDVKALAKKSTRTAMDADVLSKYGRLVLLVTREQRVADEDDAEDMSDEEVTKFLIGTVGTDKIVTTLKDMGVL